MNQLASVGDDSPAPRICAELPFALAVSIAFLVVPAPSLDAQAYQSEEHAFQVTTVAEGLEHPWSAAFLPNGDILVTERPGRLRLIQDGQVQPEPIGGVPDVFANGQGGLLDVVLHPDFAENQLVYLSFSKPSRGGAVTGVIRGRFDGTSLTDVEDIFEGDNFSDGGNHFGSRLVFDQEGYLFITVGDRAAPPRLGTGEGHPAQLLSTHAGTVVRLHDDGRVPSDNPFVGSDGSQPEIWSYGHRSLQGLALDPATGRLWESEHGPQGGDELNLIEPSRNYGWPIVGYGVNYGGAVIHDGSEREGMEQPVHYWVPSIATSGLAIYDGDAFPAWRGNAFLGALRGELLSRVVIEAGGSIHEERLLTDFGERIRDVRNGPDGFLYLLTDNPQGRLLRIEPTP
ncbi:MAG: PQQ-dependent sugar dehydrogenase [Gemmatimonas sp.]|nr:PQQ-dependent sugar dehydrogenase [Gemmatimonas sp.]